MMRRYIIIGAALAFSIGLTFSHLFAFNTGANSVTAEYQAQALDKVAAVEVKQDQLANKDSARYAELDKTHKSLQNAYDDLLKQARSKAKPNDPEKYDICTYGPDTLELLQTSAAGGLHQRISASDGGGPDNTVYLFAVARNGNSTGADRAVYRKRSPILHQSMYAPVTDRGSTRSPGSSIRI